MKTVFMSYSKEDTAQARLISETLKTAGFSVWWDRRILPGKTWDDVIGASLESASCVVVLWSDASVKSRWVREEAGQGLDRGILVPIFIQTVRPPFGFGRLEAADLSHWLGRGHGSRFANVCEAIANVLEARTSEIAQPQAKTVGASVDVEPLPSSTTLPVRPSPPPVLLGSSPAHGIYISYRHKDDRDVVRRIYDRLQTRFDNRVFLDIEAPPSLDYEDGLNAMIQKCSVMLIVIGSHWLESVQGLGRREIRAALKSGLRVIPLLVNGARMPRNSELWEDIADLANRQPFEITDTNDIMRLIEVLESIA